MDICDGYRGYIKIGSDGYIIQPLKTEILQQNNLDGTPHTLEKLSGLLGQIQLYQGTIHILRHHRFDYLPFVIKSYLLMIPHPQTNFWGIYKLRNF